MVCPRCIDSVKEIFTSLNIDIDSLLLGEVKTRNEVTQSQRRQLEAILLSKGFVLLENQKAKIINQIKTLLIEQIHYGEESLNINFSTFLINKLNYDYSSLSRLFSSVEGMTIERFILRQKIEKVKELIFYKELTLSEIAYKMNYSSVAHLSAQFKKETGLRPSEFKKMDNPNRKSLDQL